MQYTSWPTFQSLEPCADSIVERTFLDINFDNQYHLVDRRHRGHIDFVLGGHYPCPQDSVSAWAQRRKISRILELRVFHNYNDQHLHLLKWCQDARIRMISNVWHHELAAHGVIFCDFLRNLVKAYHTGFRFGSGTRPWYHVSELDYRVSSNHDRDRANKIWLSPSCTRNPAHVFRSRLFDFLYDKQSTGHLGNPHKDMCLYSNADVLLDLETNSFAPFVCNEEQKEYRYKYCPPHTAYYEDSFVSIYSESIELGESQVVTEKTYFPLVQGHFILPFGSHGFVDRLRHLGFRLPTFIDYSYDQEHDFGRRQTRFLEEVERLINEPLRQWQQWWMDHLDLIQHNRSLILQQDYDQVNVSKLL